MREARALLTAELDRLRSIPREELLDRLLDDQEVAERVPAPGASYQLEIGAFWDDPGRPGENLRVYAAINNGSWRSFVPLTDSFIVAPDGSFVDE